MIRINIFILFLLSGFAPLHSQDSASCSLQENEWASDFYEENEKCFRCHESGVAPSEELTEENIQHLRRKGLLFSREDFYNSNHGSFACVDCHSDDETTLKELVREGEFTCTNCHGFDVSSDPYQFAVKVEEYNRSVHARSEKIDFSCWKCHNPHTYRSRFDEKSNPPETIGYHNAICLNCHSNPKHQPGLQKDDSTGVVSHDWLPDRSLHFSLIRCNECHSRMNNDTIMSHLIVSAVKTGMRCVDCHSKEPRLLAGLNKFHAKGHRSKEGFRNNELSKELSVLGTSGTSKLDTISFVVFFSLLFGILIHIYIRIRGKRKK